MQYAILIHIDEQSWDRLPNAERQRVKADTDVLVADLTSSGKLKGAAVLQGSYTGRTLMRKGPGQFHVTDGPFAETKEVLAGFQLVECESIEEATAIAQRFPGLQHGFRLEIRPVGDDCSMLRTAAAARDKLHAQVFAVTLALEMPQFSKAWGYFEFEQSGADFIVSKSADCGAEVIGTGTVSLSRATMEALFIPNPTRAAIMTMAELAQMKPLPTPRMPEGAIDAEGDGELGVAGQVSGIVSGTRNSVQRDWDHWFTAPGYEITPSMDFATDLTVRQDAMPVKMLER